MYTDWKTFEQGHEALLNVKKIKGCTGNGRAPFCKISTSSIQKKSSRKNRLKIVLIYEQKENEDFCKGIVIA